jgi:tetratricopeptide (TPR) repeat protein
MAKKKLNKKVALIGSAIFMLIFFVAIGVILHLSRDPEKFIKDGTAAIIAAREATDEQVKEEAYKRAERNYHKARNLAKNDPLKIDIFFKLIDLYIETGQWRNVLGCWSRVISIDPENAKARYGRLDYFYIIADSGAQLWQEVAEQADKFIDVAEKADLLMEDTAKWQILEMQKTDPHRPSGQLLDP